MTTEPPLFSIITITRNNLEGLRRTRASIATQNFPHAQWIIIDGASDDGTADFLPLCDALILSEPDDGIYDAMNKGLDRAQGTYILFMNAGDSFASGYTLSHIRDALHGKQPDFIYGDALESLPGGQLIYKKSRHERYIHQGMITHHQAMVYRRATIRDLRFNSAFSIAGDFDFTVRFLTSAQTIMPCPFPICVFEGGGLSQQHPWRGRREQFTARARHGVPLWENVPIFAGQSALWALREWAPALYWPLKARR